MKRIILSILAFGLVVTTVWAAPGRPCTESQRAAESAEKDGPLAHSIWGVCAINMQGDTLAWLGADNRMVPASNMKLITTGAALLTFGGSYTFKTNLATDGAICDSTLNGNLYIIGGADPLIGNIFTYLPKPEDRYKEWSKVLIDNGIRRINGDIVGDGSYFSGERFHTDWSYEDFRTRDGVVPSGLTFRAKMGDTIPDGPYPAALHYLEWLQADSTIAVSGIAKEGYADSLSALGTIYSQTLRNIVKTCNYQSDNFIAETLLKSIGKKYNGDDSYKSSTEALHKALSPLGLMTVSGQMQFADGSGLSRKNYISPEFFVTYLRKIAGSRVKTDFLSSLPYAGERKTTMENRLPKAPYALRHRIRMKSGSMNGVHCFSGYILSGDGDWSKTIAFSIMTNNAVAPSRTMYPLIDSLIETLAHENE